MGAEGDPPAKKGLGLLVDGEAVELAAGEATPCNRWKGFVLGLLAGENVVFPLLRPLVGGESA